MLRKSTNEVSIRPKLSRDKIVALISVAVVTVAALLFGSYKIGYRQANFDAAENGSYIVRLEKQLRESENKGKSLTQELAVAQRKVQVQKSAYDEITSSYSRVDEKNEYLNRRVNFYRSIISPKDGRSGVKIHDVRSTLSDNGDLNLEVVLIQSIDHVRDADVHVKIEMHDSKKSKSGRHVWPESGTEVVSFRLSETLNINFKVDANDDGGKTKRLLKIVALPDNDPEKQLVEWHEI